MNKRFEKGQTIFYVDVEDDGTPIIRSSVIEKREVVVEDGEDGSYNVTVYQIPYIDGEPTWLREDKMHLSAEDAFKSKLKGKLNYGTLG